MKARILSGDEVLAVFDLREGEYVVGSSPEARLRIQSLSVAPEHARLSVGAFGVEVEDLGSGFATLHGDEPLRGRQPLPSGSAIRLGEFSVEVWDDDLDHPTGGRYKVGSIVAKGAMGVIRRARETSTGREVAMKEMHAEFESALAARFVQEARITAHLEHPNIVPVHDVSPGADGARFYTMKMVRGSSLEKILAQLEAREDAALKTYPLAALLTIFQKVCDAVAFAHSKGVIHRDLKPANIMVGEYGEVLVMDWGLAKVVGDAAEELAGKNSDASDVVGAGATLAGTVLGTPHYMAPEQASGETDWVDERSDVYALGAILYQMLTLRTPVDADSARDALRKVRAGMIISPPERVGPEALPHLPDGRIPTSLAAVAMKALALSPERRYQRVPALQAEIRAYQNGFATDAEAASGMRQFSLLLKRHQGVSTAVAASLLVLAGLSAFYTVSLVGQRNRAVASEVRAKENEIAARENAEAAKKAQREAETNARLAKENAERATANAELAQREAAAARVAEDVAKESLAARLRAEGRTTLAERQQMQAESTAKTAQEMATVAQADAEQARKTRVTQRIASLPEETDAAALRGDAGMVLVNSVFLLERETDANQQVLLRRRIGSALRQMPRLLFLKEGAALARISPNGASGVFFEGNKGTLFDRATLKGIGPSLNLGAKGSAEAVEFGSDSQFLLSAGTSSPGQPNVRMWNAATGNEVRLPPWRLEGKLECFLPYPDRSRVLTIHAASNSKNKEINLWSLDGTTTAARLKTPLIDGLVTGLVPLAQSAQFLLHRFNTSAGDRSGFVHRVEASSSSLRVSDPLLDSPLGPATAISPDGARAVRLVARQLRLAPALPPDASGKSVGPHVMSYLKGSASSAVAVEALAGEPQELLDAATGKPIGRTLTGGACVFSPDSQWLLMADGEQAFLHHALDNDPARGFKLGPPGKVSSLAFSTDSSRAIVVAEGASVSLWNTKTGRRACADIRLSSEPKEISTSASARFVFAAGDGVSLWDTAPPSPREPVDFKKLSSFAVWVSGDGRRAVAIPPSAIPAASDTSTAAPAPAPGVSPGSLTLHNLDSTRWLEPRTVARRTEILSGGTCWLTRNGRFFLVWGGGEGAKIWDMEKRSPRDIFSADHPRFRPKKYERFYDGKGVVVVESPKDHRLGLVIDGVRPDTKRLTSLFFEGTTGNELPEDATIDGSIVKDADGLQHVADLDGKATLALAAKRLRRELPPEARRAFFSDDEKLLAVLSTSPAEEGIVRPVLSELLIHSDVIGKTAEQLTRDGRPYGFTPPAGRTWRLNVYDVPTTVCLVGEVMLPALAAFRWEGARCVALSSDGRWTEIDFAPDPRPLEDLRDAAAVLTGRAIDPATGSVAPVKQPIAALVKTWKRLCLSYPGGWQLGIQHSGLRHE